MELHPQDFPRHTTDKLRYADTDRQGHVNNALFATFLETGRVEILHNPGHPLEADGTEFVVAHLSLDFQGEIHWPGSVTVGTGVQAVGTSSITFVQAIFQEDRRVARAETVVVQIDTASRESCALTGDARDRLDRLTLAEH